MLHRMNGIHPIPGIEILGPALDRSSEVLTPGALELLALLHRAFEPTRRSLLAAREQLQARLDSGWTPDFDPETASIRYGEWSVATIPPPLLDRRVEITGPPDRKMVINALNSGANMFMADFEDSNAPTWENCIRGQINLADAVAGTISYTSPEGRDYRLHPPTATLLVRPRGWHMVEKHVRVDGQPVSASLFDFVLFFHRNARALLERGAGPWFYLPKLEHHAEARLWNDVFVAAQRHLGLPVGSIKATVLIETILAAFQMHEILHELRDHVVGLNCGRWDYIFSFIKKFRAHRRFVLPDRASVTMTTHFLRSYSLLLIQTCHRRGALAMGGMAAQIPIRNDENANRAAMDKVSADKLREVTDGHDGTWVAHPGLVGLARSIFDQHMPGPNQLGRLREDVSVSASDLLTVPQGSVTERGLRQNISVSLRYIEAWLRGNGCVPIDNLMEDLATAEISRAQLWQWIRHEARTEDDQPVTMQRVQELVDAELAAIGAPAPGNRFSDAAALLLQITGSESFVEFLSEPAYQRLE
jgi:malate synthase